MLSPTKEIIGILATKYPNPKSELVYSTPYELLCAVILSAQCTDKRVNTVTPKLFSVADTPAQMAAISTEEIESLIHSCGFYHNKAKFLKEMSADLCKRFDGKVPDNLEDLRTLSGVGRKTANVVYAVAFNGAAIAVDTHVFRVANRLGIANAKNVVDTEEQLMQAIDKDLWRDSHHYLLLHGRYTCHSQRPNCAKCELQQYCQYYKREN